MARKGRKFDLEEHLKQEHHDLGKGNLLRDSILGGQDGLVNVLGVILGVAAATFETRIVLIAGLAATFAESISMAAVAYTSTKAERDFYYSEMAKEKHEIERGSKVEVDEIRELYYRKGFRGKLLDDVVKTITKDEEVWLDVMMREELQLGEPDNKSPLNSAFVVGVSAIIGSLLPLIPFVFMPVSQAIPSSVVLAAVVLFAAGIIKAKLTIGSWWKTGTEMAVIGVVSALVGYFIGAWLGVAL